MVTECEMECEMECILLPRSQHGCGVLRMPDQHQVINLDGNGLAGLSTQEKEESEGKEGVNAKIATDRTPDAKIYV